MRLVIVKDEYLDYLKSFSENVKHNKQEKRPYVGIVLSINGHNYFAPLGSPKPKHKQMKEAVDFIKIDSGNLGVVNLNNMIPVPCDKIKEIDFSIYDKKYKELLKDQSVWLRENSEKINKKAEKLYILITTKENTIFHNRSNDFKYLEEKAKEYEKELNLIEEAKDQEIPQEKPLEEVKEQEISQEKPLEEVKDQEILQEKPLEEAPKDDPWKKKLENDKAKGLSLGR